MSATMNRFAVSLLVCDLFALCFAARAAACVVSSNENGSHTYLPENGFVRGCVTFPSIAQLVTNRTFVCKFRFHRKLVFELRSLQLNIDTMVCRIDHWTLKIVAHNIDRVTFDGIQYDRNI